MADTHGKKEFDPSGVGLKNGNFIGLPFNEESAKSVLLPVPWDVTVSYGEGTALAPEAILGASSQLDLYDPDVKDAWKQGIFMHLPDRETLEIRNRLRPLAARYITFLESGGEVSSDHEMQSVVTEINAECEKLNDRVYRTTRRLLSDHKKVGVIGGDHSTPLGYLKALAEKHPEFGVLQIDAHMDLRESYEGFTFSHASVFYNALEFSQIKKLVQVGIRDCCDEEIARAESEKDRVAVFFDQKLKEERFEGATWSRQCEKIISGLPEKVYVSFDIDGLDPKLCPNTGTPVAGGLEFTEATFLLKRVVESGREIIGFDLCETGNAEWDANVAARIIYKLSNLMVASDA